MSSEHILVDGYSMLHQWPELKAARTRGIATGRQALIHLLTRYHDARGGRRTVGFDGRSLPKGGEATPTGMGGLYSRAGESADAVIERIVGQSATPSSFLVATDDHAEQNVVEGLGGRTVSADVFRLMLTEALDDLEMELDRISTGNRRFNRGR